MRSGDADPELPAAGAAAASSAGPEPDASPGLWRRAALIFVRPARAWEGLGERAGWWFPLVLVAIVSSLTMLLTFDRAYLPMMTEGMERQVADGQMTQEHLERAEAFFGGPAGKAVNVGFLVVGLVVMTTLLAIVVWLGGAFILGREGFGFRLAFEIAAWSGLITLPSSLLASLLAYARGVTIKDVHVGFGFLVGEPETPSRLTTSLGVFLDGLGPLAIWHVGVAVLGLASLGRVSPRQAALVLGSLYLGYNLLLAGTAGMAGGG